MDKPKLLVIASTYPRWRDDHIPGFVHELSRRLTDSFDVHVLAPLGPDMKRSEILDLVTVHRFKYAPERISSLAYGGGILTNLKKNPLNVILLPLFLASQIISTRRLVKTYQYNLIHAHWLIPQGLTTFISLIGLKYTPPVICTSHGADLFSLPGFLFIKLKAWVLNHSAHVTAVSSAMKEEINRIAPGVNVSVIPMGTDLQHNFTPDGRTKRSRNILLFVGRLTHKKGLDVLIKALPSAMQKYSQLELYIAGYGPLENELKALAENLNISKSVCFLGPVTHQELPPLLRKAAITIIPSRITKSGDQEGFGLVIVEAIGCESPVITTSLPAINDITDYGKYAKVIPPDDPASITKAIHDILTNQDNTSRMVLRARTYVVNKFDWAQISKQYAKVILKTIKESEDIDNA